MKAPQHTPGPWFARYGGLSGVFNSSEVLLVTSECANTIQNEANARLISAAPDMLAALVKLMEQYDSSPDFTMGGYLTNEPFLMARDALKKAGCEF